jgi:hypothetical protein
MDLLDKVAMENAELDRRRQESAQSEVADGGQPTTDETRE